jgi:hypothetical protein
LLRLAARVFRFSIRGFGRRSAPDLAEGKLVRRRRRSYYNPHMTVWLRRCTSFAEEAEADREFWARFSPDERVAIVEQMRREWMEKNGRLDEGLRRTARLLEAARS